MRETKKVTNNLKMCELRFRVFLIYKLIGYNPRVMKKYYKCVVAGICINDSVLVRQKYRKKTMKIDIINLSYENDCSFFIPEGVAEAQLTNDQQRTELCCLFLSSSTCFPFSGIVKTFFASLSFDVHFFFICVEMVFKPILFWPQNLELNLNRCHLCCLTLIYVEFPLAG